MSASPTSAVADKRTEFPTPPMVSLEEKIEAVDLGVRMETLMLRTGASVADSVAAYRDVLVTHGWREQRRPAAAQQRTARVLEFQKGPQHSQILIMPSADRPHRTRIMVHWIKAG